MSPLDKESLQSKINRIRKNLKQLKLFGDMSYTEYTKDSINTAVAERFLQISIQAMLDIGSHIIAEEGLGDPLEYRDIFSILIHAKILPKHRETAFLNMVGLRNRIVHLYEDIDHKRIHHFLKKDLSDFETFLKAATRYLR
ncbi:MAG: DUF86 domain-containing protein [Deltaproteobacteria bacterium]|nr:DUF86 domain-containing protein [Deltaproteobacteria bacterium]